MQFHSGKRNKHPFKIVGFVLGFFLILVLIVFHTVLGNWLSGIIARASLHSFDAYQGVPYDVLRARLKDAENELARIRYQSVLYQFEVEQRQLLESALLLPESEVIARGRVFARPPRTHYDTLLVAVQNNTDVQPGDYAFVFNTLIGEIAEVRGTTALVRLFSSPGLETEVRVGVPSAIVMMQGLGAGAFLFHTPKEVSLSSGEIVSSSEHTAVIAIIQSVIDEPERTTNAVYAATPVASADMEIVEFKRPHVINGASIEE